MNTNYLLSPLYIVYYIQSAIIHLQGCFHKLHTPYILPHTLQTAVG